MTILDVPPDVELIARLIHASWVHACAAQDIPIRDERRLWDGLPEEHKNVDRMMANDVLHVLDAMRGVFRAPPAEHLQEVLDHEFHQPSGSSAP